MTDASARVTPLAREPALRLGSARRVGVTAGQWRTCSRFRPPITVEASGELEGLTAALRSTDDYGFCTAVAIHFAPTVPLPLLEMYTHGITLHCSRADSRRLLLAVLELFADGRFAPLAVPTTIVPWDRADEAWLAPATKLVIERD